MSGNKNKIFYEYLHIGCAYIIIILHRFILIKVKKMARQRIAYTPQGGVCSKQMVVDIEDGMIVEAQIIGGCHGNSQGICSLLKHMPIEEAIQRMEGIHCRGKETSCPDQMAQALKLSRR